MSSVYGGKIKTYDIPVTKIRSCYWEPKEDITTYELALCLGPLLAATGGRHSVGDFVETIPECAQRHFRFTD
jgi:hypothetical protein